MTPELAGEARATILRQVADIDRLQGANKELAREAQTWQTAVKDHAEKAANLAALVRELSTALQLARPDHDLPGRAMAYLKRKGLESCVLRDNATLAGIAFDTLPDDFETN